ncbi:ribokinase [Oscillibacter valericigenes]|uniref:ribokinase n=1 Tax=Oscillibacter valericigenes TaxID=351091 RepID=UPI001F18C773|nr:ribokinase [Oscillibacter valericigenes]MCF2616825.1 ribokinase [Oscillibacter valericigenes]
MHRKPRILVVGSFVMDVIATTEKVPRSAQTVYGKSFHMAPGGKGANQALQCARLGAQVTMMGCVGDDLFGEKLIEPLKSAGVDVSHVLVRPGVSSGVGHVTLEVTEHSAQNRIIVIPGANRTLTVDEVAWIQDEIGTYDMVLLQLEVPLEVNRTVARWAKEAGVPVMLNPAPATDLDDELLRYVTYLTPNEQEASMETGLPLASDENGPCRADLQKIAAALWDKGVEHVIITLGGSGSAVVQGSSIRYIPCVHMDHVADPTAAGDSFVGALSVGLTAGLSQEEALAFASHTAAITVSRMGAMPSLPTLAEVLELVKERDYRGFDPAALDILK